MGSVFSLCCSCVAYVLTVTQNICEGKKDVDARMDAPTLIELALDTVLPKVLAFGRGFPWRTEEFVVRDAAWVDLSGHSPTVPYFLAQCLVQSRRGPKTTTFKTKRFSLMVVVPAAQWSEYVEWLEKTEEEVRFCLFIVSSLG